MSEWKSVKLGELYEVHNGLSKGRKFFGSGYPFLSFSTVFNNYFIPDELTDLVQSTESERNSYSIHRGDIFVTRTSETSDELGMSCVALKDYPDATYNGFTKRMRPITDRVLPEYIGYYMRMPSFRGEFQAFSTMTTRASLKNEDLLSLSVSLPSLDEQNKISQTLLNYDNLIENNQKQIKLLEEAAQRLYKEWFVDLRFPGYEDVQIVDGVPEGWNEKLLCDVISYEIGGGWGEEFETGNNEHEAYVIRGTDFDGLKNGNFLSIPLRFHTERNLSSRKLEHGDIVFEVSGGSRTEGVARTVRINEEMLNRWHKPVMCASFCKLIRPLSVDLSQYLFDHLRYLRSEKITEEFDKRSASSIVNFRWKDFLSQRTILYPDSSVLGKYNSIAVPLYDRLVSLSLQIETAKQARDRLLPKLMSGEIEL